MTAKQNRPEEILHQAIKITEPAEQKKFLDKACEGNESLRAEVESLLKAYAKSGDFLEIPAIDPNVTAQTNPLTEKPGTVIGRYKILEKISEGGMAVVYMAEQKLPVRRKVALKIIKLGMDTKEVIARFEAERQALALMDHPHIAKVFDAGTTDSGRPYFVMEMVRGISITDYCDQQKLPTRERLELFLQVCNAVQHAHQKGIIHRDLKPSNIMVTLHDGRHIAVVIDFGIAKATSQQLTEKTLFTRYAQMIDTPEYMSPEQAEMSRMDVDTRTDIYSLGVLLYELLTGTTPLASDTLRAAGYAEIQRLIRESQPPKPSTRLSSLGETLSSTALCRQTTPENLRKTLKGDLDWIVMKSLDKDRTRRYETAHALAEDIERHLRDEPVLAGPPSTVERCRKFVRRHRAMVGGAAVVLLVLLLGIIGMAVFAFKADRARDEATAFVRFLEEDIFGTLDPWQAQNVGVEELLDAAHEKIEAGAYRDEPLVEANARKWIGTAYFRLGQFQRADHHLHLAMESFKKLHGEYDPETLKTEIELSYLYFLWLRPDEAEPIIVKTLEGCRQTFGDRHAVTLKAMHILGNVYMFMGRQEAESLLTESWEIARQELGGRHEDTLLYTCCLGLFRFNQGRLEEAEELLTDALSDPQSRIGYHQYHFMDTLALIYKNQKQRPWRRKTITQHENLWDRPTARLLSLCKISLLSSCEGTL
jgi:tetratricopeptide (TPR) repeat protein